MSIEDDFYKTIEDPEVYDKKLTVLGGQSPYYFDDYDDISFGLDEATTEESIEVTPEVENLNVAAFQFIYDGLRFVNPGNVITCTLTSLSFTYSCN